MSNRYGKPTDLGVIKLSKDRAWENEIVKDRQWVESMYGEYPEALQVILDDDDHVIEIQGSKELLEQCSDQFRGVKQTIIEPVLVDLKLPEIERANND